MEVKFDYSKLIGRIIECFGTQYEFAKAMGFSEHTISLKLNDKVSWKDTDILKAVAVLGLDDSDIPQYFFTPKVQKFEHTMQPA